MLVNKKALILEKILSKDDNVVLSNLCITNDKTIATNGKILLELKHPSQDLVQEFPLQPKSTKEQVLICPKTIAKIKANMKEKVTLPMLENFIINKEDKNIEITMNDLDNEVKIKQAILEGVEYPDISEVYPADEPKIKIRLSINLLEELVSVIKPLSDNDHLGIDFTIYGVDKAIKIDYKNQYKDVDLQGVILPMRQDND